MLVGIVQSQVWVLVDSLLRGRVVAMIGDIMVSLSMAFAHLGRGVDRVFALLLLFLDSEVGLGAVWRR
jgi:hypothetical protein